MKKIKILLTAITVFAVVGGALAFKAKTYGSIIYTTSNQVSGAFCPLPLQNFTADGSGTYRATTKAPDNISGPQGYACSLVQTASRP